MFIRSLLVVVPAGKERGEAFGIGRAADAALGHDAGDEAVVGHVEGVRCYNPAFDVTDHTLISGIVTEYGICRPPFSQSLKKLFETISEK